MNGDLDKAAGIYRSILVKHPDHPGALHLLGVIAHQRGRHDRALTLIERAVALNQANPRFYNSLGLVYVARRNYAAAGKAYRQALKIDCDFPEPVNNLGIIELEIGNIAGAAEWFKKTLNIRPDYAPAHNNLGLCRKRTGAYDRALDLFKMAIERDPGFADAHWNLALTLLLLGRFEQGWPEYEWRFKRAGWRKFYPHKIEKPRWTSAPIPGKRLLVHYEQGFGDIFQFVRYLPMVKQACRGTVIFESKAPVAPLLQNFSGIDELVVAAGSGPTGCEYDFHVPLLSLPGIFKTSASSIPFSGPYLQSNPDKKKVWQAYLEPRRGRVNIGLVWSGRSAHTNDDRRSLLPEFFAPIFEMRGVKVFGIQKDLPDPIRIGSGDVEIENIGPHLVDFSDTAAVLDCLDLLITVDTAVAHLAGAMGRPVWTLLPFVPDWRWQLNREESPWYPAMKLFRQEKPGEWLPVIRKITAELKTAVNDGGMFPEDVRSQYRLGLSQLTAGKVLKAKDAFEKTVALNPGHADAHYNLGVILQKEGRYHKAIDAYESALKLDPQNPDSFYNLGNCFQYLQQPVPALRCYRETIRLRPSFTGAHNNMGLMLKNRGKLDEAIHSFNIAIRLDPGVAIYHNNLGLTFQKQGNHAHAIDCYKISLELDPDSPVTHYNLAAACDRVADHEKAIKHLGMAVDLNPDFVGAYHNLGEILSKSGRYAEAVERYRRALSIKPDAPETCNSLGNALDNLGRTAEAIKYYKKAIRLRPGHAGAYTNLGTAYYEDRQLALAEKHYRQALEIEPDFTEAVFNMALVNLLKGDLEKGWPGYEKRFYRSDWNANYPFRFDQPKWDGTPFDGQKLLVHDEQGLGDTLQFVRYLERVKTLGGTVLFETRRPFLELLKKAKGIDRLVERTADGKPAVDFDLYCPLLSLPGLFSTSLDSIPARVPYIEANPEKAALWSRRMDGQVFKVGVVWSGNPTHFRGLNRSVSLDAFARLFQIPGVCFYSFQKGKTALDAARYQEAGLLENLGELFADFSDTAAAMENMDLVISIDTSVAHLAGAMGKPVWVLLAYASDWRWLTGRSDSPWYPTMRLFRQEKRNDWASVLDDVESALKELLMNS